MEKNNTDIEIIISYYKEGKSMREIEKITKHSFTKIQKEIKSYDFNKKINNIYKEYDNKILLAICKKTGKEFSDYKNQSGMITDHIKKEYPNYTIESNFKRKSFEYTNLKYWYHDFFDFIYKDKIVKKTKSCLYCEWKTEDIDNKSGAYQNHLKNVHNISIEEHIKNNPKDKVYFKNKVKYINREKILKNQDNFVTCKVCGVKYKNINNKHLKKHNITLKEYKTKYNITDVSEFISNKTHKKILINRKTKFKPKKFNKRSNAENELCLILDNYKIKYKKNVRSLLDGVEVDIFIPDKKLMIEYNGVYFHSEYRGKKDSNYHVNKLKIANEKGYQMIQIFEDEWLFNRHVVINKFLHILGVNKNEKIFARKCNIEKIDDPFIKNNFLNRNHIQGEDKSNIHYGAYYNDKLVAVMTFDNKRVLSKEKNHDENIYELKRFATDINYNVIGIGSKLFSHFIKEHNPSRVISFADLRWTINKKDNFYTKIGFNLDKVLRQDYTYIKYSGIEKNKRLHKFAFGKKRLKVLFPEIYDDNKTEWEIMQEAGYDRIWDCGKLKYVYDCTSI